MKKQVCWKCRWLITKLGFLSRKKKTGPCDRCLGKVTTMQTAFETKIWLKHIPPRKNGKNKEVQQEKKTQKSSKEPLASLGSSTQSSKS